ncbi:MAG: cytochrome c oxidase accessory protein CcoG, partial [Gammaproteobacteria bacterium]|nr:cytochrome c oxidase accessory protein CcoG [Gammaproteobacteria bacterium]
DGRVENVYTLKLQNKTEEPQQFELYVDGLPGLTLETDPPTPRLEPGAIASVAARVQVDPEGARAGGHEVVFSAARADDESLSVSREARFILPSR